MALVPYSNMFLMTFLFILEFGNWKQRALRCKRYLPEMMVSLQVPLTSTFPSGQVHLAPVGFRRHMKSQDILRQGFEAVKKEKKKSQEDNLLVLACDAKDPFVCEKCGFFFLCQRKVIFFQVL